MTEPGRARAVAAVVGVLVLALVVAGEARAQEISGSGTPPDVFAGSADTYTDAAATSCTKNNPSPYAGMNPLVCYGVMAPVDSAGKCSLARMYVLKQEGNTCYYCQPINPPIQGFIVPIDDVAQANAQGFECGVDQAAENCMAVCQGGGTFKPPPGTIRESTLTPQMPPNNTVQIYSECGGRTLDSLPKWTPAQAQILAADIANAKAMVVKAKAYTDKVPWDAGTLAIGKKYFGDISSFTEQNVRTDVNNVLALLGKMTPVGNSVYPDKYAGLPTSPVTSSWIAYTQPLQSGPQPVVFICPLFWQQPTTGPNSQAAAMVHEMSHLPGGASTVDFAYGQQKCEDLVILATPLGSFFAPLVGAKGVPAQAPLMNADSFKYFVYYVANQK
jgi:Lysine-specific metallo-endopeptidase